jgi:hypothetical protein
MNHLVNANDKCGGSKSAGQAQRFFTVYGVVAICSGWVDI